MKKFKKYKTSELINCLPENIPLYKDSGLWQFRTDDMENEIIGQNPNESFRHFILRYIQYLQIYKLHSFLFFLIELKLSNENSIK